MIEGWDSQRSYWVICSPVELQTATPHLNPVYIYIRIYIHHHTPLYYTVYTVRTCYYIRTYIHKAIDLLLNETAKQIKLNYICAGQYIMGHPAASIQPMIRKL